MKLKRLFKYLWITTASLIAAFILLLAGLEFFIPDSRIAGLVTKVSDKFLNAQVHIGKVNLATFSHFPYIGVNLEEGHIISKMDNAPQRADTLLSFGRFTFLFNPAKLLFNHIDIHGVMISSPKVYAYVSKEGKANWDILKTEPDTLHVQADSTGEEFSFNINVRHIAVTDRGRFTFDSRKDDLRASLSMNSLNLKGRLTNDLKRARIREGNFSRLNVAVTQGGVEKYLSGLVASNAAIPDSLSGKNREILSRANRASLRFAIDTLNMASSGKGAVEVDAKTRTNIRIARHPVAENIPLDINGIIKWGRGGKSIGFDGLRITIAQIPVVMDGTVDLTPEGPHTDSLYAAIEEFPLEEFLKHVPKAIIPQIKKIQTNTRISAESRICGTYDPVGGIFPSADIKIRIPHSHISIEGKKEKIKDLHLDAQLYYRPDAPDSTRLEINEMLIDGDGILLDAGGKITSLMGDPHINMKMKGAISIDSLIRMLPEGTDIYGKGDIDANMQINSRLSHLTPYSLGKAGLKADFTADDVEFGIPSRNIQCNIYGGRLYAGSSKNTRDTAIALGTKMLGLNIIIDSTYIKYADSLLIRGRDIRFNGHNEASLFDTLSKNVKPFNGTLTARLFSLSGADSTHLRISGSQNTFSILPYKGDFSIPSIHLSSSNRRLMLRQDVNFLTITGGSFALQANRNDAQAKQREQRMSRLADSLQIIYPEIPRDSLMSHWIQERRKLQGRNFSPDDFATDDYNFRLTDKGLLYLLNRWDASGSLNADMMRIATPAFPLRTRIESPHMSFDMNRIAIDKARIQSGHSSFEVSGNVSGIKGALSRGSRIRVKMSVDADTLNFNELAKAAAMGEEYLAGKQREKDTLILAASEEEMEEMVALEGGDTLSKMALIVIPKNIDAELDMNVKYGIYSSITLNGAKGKINSRDRCLQIMDFNATTSAGAMDLNAFYRTRSRDNLAVGFDLQFKDMDMGEFIRLYPGMDTLLPMLKSFEGIINCQIAATSQIDTNMNFMLPTIEGVARIKGDSLVLLDGETFAEIAKMMKFKNRERNLVDSIAVEIAINDNQIEIFPFIMKMDRYTTAISGKQDMDMNLNYHISVLKSPIPMRMGINITGNLDDFKFKIGKALYKDTNIPVYSKVIDSTRINLLEKIKEIYKTTY